MYIAYDEDINSIFKDYFPVMKAVSGQFGNQCETVIHDFSNHRKSIVAMIGNVTGRELYAPLTNYLGSLVYEKGDDVEDQVGYITYFQGKHFRSSAIFIRDNNSKVIGCLCINYCVQDLFALKKITEQLTTSRSVDELNKNAKEEYYAKNVDDFVNNIMQVIIEEKGLDLSVFTKEERIKLIKELEQRGIFLVKGTVEKLAEKMGISKYTIYSYIDQIKK